MDLNNTVLEQMISYYQNDSDMIELICNAFDTFERYHASIIRLEVQRKLYRCGAMDSETYREKIPELDQARSNIHNAVLAEVKLLNRLAASAGLPPLYDGTVSEERPYRREVANAVMACLASLIEHRS